MLLLASGGHFLGLVRGVSLEKKHIAEPHYVTIIFF